jgi:protein TonB
MTLPNLSASYLNNPPPVYPPISKRMGEQGRVVMRVLIDEQGLPQKAELMAGSGYSRLDQAAEKAVMSWRYVPGQRGGRPQAMWFNVPISFELKPTLD